MKNGYFVASAQGVGFTPHPFNLEPQTYEKCQNDIEAAIRSHAIFYGNRENVGIFWIVSAHEAMGIEWQRGPYTTEAFKEFKKLMEKLKLLNHESTYNLNWPTLRWERGV